jgi:hypothetical protein
MQHLILLMHVMHVIHLPAFRRPFRLTVSREGRAFVIVSPALADDRHHPSVFGYWYFHVQHLPTSL